MGSKKSSSSAPPAPWTKGYDPKGSGRWKNAGGTMFSKGPSGSMGAAKKKEKKKHATTYYDEIGPGGGR
jgi:hypothetical protein